MYIFVASCNYYGCNEAEENINNNKQNYTFNLITQNQNINENSDLILKTELIDLDAILESQNIKWVFTSSFASLSSNIGDSVLLNVFEVSQNETILIKCFPESDSANFRELFITILDTTKIINDTSVCFERDVMPIFRSNCALSGCHSDINPEDDLPLTSYSEIMKKIKPFDLADSKIFKVITRNDDEVMPPSPYSKLTTDQIELIRKWIIEGAKNNTCEEETDCDLSNITYDNSIKSIIANNCLGCHSATSKFGGIDLTNKTNCKNVINNGRLIPSIEHKTGYSAMPLGGKLSQCDIDKIKTWSNEGFK